MKEVSEPSAQSVDVIYAGGTISSVTTDEGYREGGHAFHLTALEDDLADRVGHEEVAFTGLSENMTPAIWKEIDERIEKAIERKPHAILLTHGTDSMQQTSQHLLKKFGATLKTNNIKIILTGAHEDMYHPDTDVWENLDFAIEQALSDAPASVFVAYHGNLIPGAEVSTLPFLPGTKRTFASNQSEAYQKALDRQQAVIKKQKKALLESYNKKPDASRATLYDVNVIRDNHQDFLNYILVHPETKAVLLNLYHSGTANTDKPAQSVTELVQALRATRKDLVFFGVTESGEPVELRAYETSVSLRKAGVVPLYDMLREVALAKLQLLDADLSPKQRIEAMLKNQVGEIDESQINQADIKNLIELYEA